TDPTTCPSGPLTNVVAIATGGFVQLGSPQGHSLALLADGTVVGWGSNPNGQVRDGTTAAPRKVPFAVTGVSNAVAIVAGSKHSAALKADGTLMGWGLNNVGQVG